MSEKKEFIINNATRFGAMPYGGLDKKSFMIFVEGHLRWLRGLKEDGYTDIVNAPPMLEPRRPASRILHLDKWVRNPTTQALTMNIDKLIELMEDPNNKKFPLENDDE